ncbi:MAG: tRNA preQ1(34) S-adenosylmethionine ribosyltransferase-isomerase QueA [Chloroflexi bacterium]|nr:tRNA preQ1(34) S-adenosylmethionine ribosyltransferase-isomerase QueA [Chloroflexota bacterium]
MTHISEFDYDLPAELIAQTPVEPRDSSRLMIVNRATHDVEASHHFRDILDMIDPGDVLVLNTTRVIPARLPAIKPTGGAAEVLLLRPLTPTRWEALIGGKNLRVGSVLTFHGAAITAAVVLEKDGPVREIEFSEPPGDHLQSIGETPLPPYIHERVSDPERYQTVYSREQGSAAAPTAGLHFTPELLIGLRDKGVQFAHCMLHIGLDTFQPVKVEQIEQHHIHSERAALSATDAEIINRAKLAGRRIIAVGTTSARTLETAGLVSAGGDPAHPDLTPDACPWRPVSAFNADTRLYITPGYRWRVVDAMITNFHLPKSTLLMMISSFGGHGLIRSAYETAKREHFRFFSFGDAMFII